MIDEQPVTSGSPVSAARTRRRRWPAVLVSGLVVASALAIVTVRSSSDGDLPFDAGVQAAWADDFVESIGVNTHLRYSDTSYDEFELVKRRLVELGVRHIRDGFTDSTPEVYERFNSLADSGIKTTFVMGEPDFGGAGSPYGNLEELYAILRTTVLRSADAVEGPNELDLSDLSDWDEAARQYQRELYEIVTEEESTEHLPVLAPSIGRSNDRERYSRLGDMTGSADIGNLHVYPGGVMMSDEILMRAVSAVREVSGGLPIRMTETGYHQSLDATDQPEGHPAVTPQVAGVLVPRILFETFRAGVERTFIYEFLDQRDDPRTAEMNFGMLTHDFEPKPAFTAVRNLIAILADRGETIRPGALEFTVEGGGPDLRSSLLQKRDGTFYVAMWQQVEVEDGPRCESAVDDETATVVLSQPVTQARIFRPSCSAEPLAAVVTDGELSVPITSDVVLVELKPGG